MRDGETIVDISCQSTCIDSGGGGDGYIAACGERQGRVRTAVSEIADYAAGIGLTIRALDEDAHFRDAAVHARFRASRYAAREHLVALTPAEPDDAASDRATRDRLQRVAGYASHVICPADGRVLEDEVRHTAGRAYAGKQPGVECRGVVNGEPDYLMSLPVQTPLKHLGIRKQRREIALSRADFGQSYVRRQHIVRVGIELHIPEVRDSRYLVRVLCAAASARELRRILDRDKLCGDADIRRDIVVRARRRLHPVRPAHEFVSLFGDGGHRRAAFAVLHRLRSFADYAPARACRVSQSQFNTPELRRDCDVGCHIVVRARRRLHPVRPAHEFVSFFGDGGHRRSAFTVLHRL